MFYSHKKENNVILTRTDSPLTFEAANQTRRCKRSRHRTDQTAPVRSDVEKNFKYYLFIYLFYFAGAGGGPH